MGSQIYALTTGSTYDKRTGTPGVNLVVNLRHLRACCTTYRTLTLHVQVLRCLGVTYGTAKEPEAFDDVLTSFVPVRNTKKE